MENPHKPIVFHAGFCYNISECRRPKLWRAFGREKRDDADTGR